MKFICQECGHSVEADEAPGTCMACGGAFSQAQMPNLKPLGDCHEDGPSTVPQTPPVELPAPAGDGLKLRPLGDGLPSGREGASKLDQKFDHESSAVVDPKVKAARMAGRLQSAETPPAPKKKLDVPVPPTPPEPPPTPPEPPPEEESAPPPDPKKKLDVPAPSTPPEEESAPPAGLRPLGDKKRPVEKSTAVPDDAPEPAGLRKLGKPSSGDKLDGAPEEMAHLTPKAESGSKLGVNRSGSFMSGDAGQRYSGPMIRITVHAGPQAAAQTLVNAVEMAFARERVRKKIVVTTAEGMAEPLKDDDIAITIGYAEGPSPMWTVDYEDGRGRNESYQVDAHPDPENTPAPDLAKRLKASATPVLNKMLKMATGRTLLNPAAGRLVLIGFVLGLAALAPYLGFVLAPIGLICSIVGVALLFQRGLSKHRFLGIAAIVLNLAAPFTFLLLP